MTREEIEKKAEEYSIEEYSYCNEPFVYSKDEVIDSAVIDFIAGAEWMQEQNGWRPIEELPSNFEGYILVKGDFDGYDIAHLYYEGLEEIFEDVSRTWNCEVVDEGLQITHFKYID